MKKIIKFFDKLEDKIRISLSKAPIIYALVGGVGIVLFWRGIWDLSEEIGLSSLWSLIISLVILLLTGLFVSFFIGDRFIISSLKGEKKIIEKTREELEAEESRTDIIIKELGTIEKKLDKILEEDKKQ